MKSLDPNVIIPIVSFLAAWVYHRIKGDKDASIRSLLESVITQVVHSPGIDLDNVRSRAESRILELLAKKNITGAFATALVHEFVERAAAKLHEEFDLVQANVEAMERAAAKLPDAFTPTTTHEPIGEIEPFEDAPTTERPGPDAKPAS